MCPERVFLSPCLYSHYRIFLPLVLRSPSGPFPGRPPTHPSGHWHAVFTTSHPSASALVLLAMQWDPHPSSGPSAPLSPPPPAALTPGTWH